VSDPLVATRATAVWPRRTLLTALLVAGVVGLRALDRAVVRGYRDDVGAQAQQAAAALEGALTNRVARLHSLVASLGAAANPAARRERFHVIAEEIQRSAPDVRFQYLIDTAGIVQELHGLDTLGAARIRIATTSEAFHAARASLAPRLSSTIPLLGGGLGLVVYDPILRRGRIIGFVGGGVAYSALFSGPLARQLGSRTPSHVLDDRGTEINRSAAFPETLSVADQSRLLTRDVILPDGRRWQLQVMIGAREPAAARAAVWIIGLALLATLIVIAVREERRAEAAALHTIHLEGLSRRLLDANLELEERAAQVIEANRAKSRFLAHVSHELRTPLNAILGYNGLAREGIYGPLSPELAEAHERIRTAATHLLGVVDSVLDLSKLELNRLGVDPTDVRIDALLADIAALVEPGAEAKGLRLDVVIEPDVPLLRTDARHLRRALLALVSNAIKYTDSGAITLAASYDASTREPHVAIAVEDTGPGIAAEDHARIFEEFEQVRPAGRGDSIARGAGLGLTVARKLVRLLGGDVCLVSARGAGARFVITLPLHAFAAVART